MHVDKITKAVTSNSRLSSRTVKSNIYVYIWHKSYLIQMKTTTPDLKDFLFLVGTESRTWKTQWYFEMFGDKCKVNWIGDQPPSKHCDQRDPITTTHTIKPTSIFPVIYQDSQVSPIHHSKVNRTTGKEPSDK